MITFYRIDSRPLISISVKWSKKIDSEDQTSIYFEYDNISTFILLSTDRKIEVFSYFMFIHPFRCKKQLYREIKVK